MNKRSEHEVVLIVFHLVYLCIEGANMKIKGLENHRHNETETSVQLEAFVSYQ